MNKPGPSPGSNPHPAENIEKLSVSASVTSEDAAHSADVVLGGGATRDMTVASMAGGVSAEVALLGTLPGGAAVRTSGWPGVAAQDLTAAPRSQAIDEDRNLTFEEIHRKYETKIFNLILRVVGNRDDAEDLTVDTFVNAYRAWGRFRFDSRVSTWLHQIAINNCKNRFKQKDRRREREPISLDDVIDTESGELSREVADWRNVPERRLMEQELARQIQKAIEALAPEYRTVLVLAQMEDMSYEEIAAVTKLSVPAVKTRLHRARNMMRRRLEPYYRGWIGPQD